MANAEERRLLDRSDTLWMELGRRGEEGVVRALGRDGALARSDALLLGRWGEESMVRALGQDGALARSDALLLGRWGEGGVVRAVGRDGALTSATGHQLLLLKDALVRVND